MTTTKVKDYVDEVAEKFPELTKEEISRILTYGWKMVLSYVSSGNDVTAPTSGFFFFIGKIPTHGLTVFKNYCTKLARRINFMFRRTQSEWDGCYYFARTENQYLDYLQQSRKKYKTFKDVFLYKLLEEIKIDEHTRPYIFRLEEDKTSKYKKYYPELRTDKAELIIQREPLKMKDILVTQNKFKYLQ